MVPILPTACAWVKTQVEIMLTASNLVSRSKFQKDRLANGGGSPIWARLVALFKPELGPCFSLCYSVLHQRLLQSSLDPPCDLL